MNENILEDATFDWLAELGYECLHGDEVSPGGDAEDRGHYSDVVLESRVRSALSQLNPGAALTEIDEAFSKLSSYASQSLIDGNKELYDWLRNGVPVEKVDSDGIRGTAKLKILDFDGQNNLLALRQFTVHGQKVRRPDVVVFVNGLPLVVLELKNPADLNADIESAFNQIQTYKTDIPQLFYFNLLNIISDGTVARYGSLTANFGRFTPWRLLNGQKQLGNAQMELEVMVRGLLEPKTLINYFKGFVAYGGESGQETYKIIAQWHQYHGVLKASDRASDALMHKKDGKGGVIWFTQGSGKSLLALFYVMNLRDKPEFKNPTIVLVTDRNDLDGQLYETFSLSSWSLRGSPVQANSRSELKDILSQSQAGGIIFTTINKFAPEKGTNKVESLCDRSNVIVIADEAHRTQYGFKASIDGVTGKTKYGLAKYMRDAMPNAIYLGMTGTPISFDDRDTESVFGEYVDVYDMIAAQEDGAVVPVSYESRIIELTFNEAERQALMEDFIENTEEEDESEQSKTISRYTRLEELAISNGRIEVLAEDLVTHWENRKEAVAGKAMIVAVSRKAAVALYDAITNIKKEWHSDDIHTGNIKVIMTSSSSDPEDFQPHRTDKKERKLLEKRFKDEDDALEIVIVRDMWLTGFDAPPVHTLYADKPMKGHGLMQAIARTNRIWKDKPGGLVVDYIGIGEELKQAIKTYTRESGNDNPPVDISGEALGILLDSLDVIRKEYYHGFDYSGIEDPKKALSLLQPAMEHILQVNPEPDKKGRNQGVTSYLDQVAKVTKAQGLAGTQKRAMEYREEIAFFQAVKVALIKLTRSGAPSGKSKLEKEAALRQLVAKGVLVEGVNDIYGTLGLDKPDISLLDESFLEKIREMPTKNLAAELLSRLVADQVKARSQKNAIQGKEFTKKLEEAINKYQNRGLTTVEVMNKIIEIAKELNASRAPDGMTDEEYAFYQALSENESARDQLGHPVLKALALELTDKLRKSATINWQNRKSSRAKMMAMIKVLLKRHRYPPDNEKEATEKIITQAELLADNWAFEV
jgi:type I restriction enzyme R subunit